MTSVGDRVALDLPYRIYAKSRQRYGSVRATGTVIAVDIPGLPPGVEIALDFPVNGAQSCYAVHEEISPAAMPPETERSGSCD